MIWILLDVTCDSHVEVLGYCRTKALALKVVKEFGLKYDRSLGSYVEYREGFTRIKRRVTVEKVGEFT